MIAAASSARALAVWMVATVPILLAAACEAPVSDGARGAVSATGLPEGYLLRLDRRNRSPSDFVTTPIEGGLRIRTGPAGILYRPGDSVSEGDFTVAGRFTEVSAPVGHREGFGLFVGGRGLDRPDQRYLYFLVRADGRFLVKERRGRDTEELSDGWQPSESVRVAAMEDGDVTNELRIDFQGGSLGFYVNGDRVAELENRSAHGIAGIRVNHNLTVRVQGFRLER